jgi:hypothetical protein
MSDTFAPELPAEILGRILALRAGEVVTLCAAACVSRAWHDAAMQPRLWRNLRNFERFPATHYQGPVILPLTDARLATLVQRASGALERLDVSQCELITARGVVAALRGECLEGQLQELCVEGVIVISDAGADADVIAPLRTFLHECCFFGGFLDVHEHLLCNADVGEPGAPHICARLCKGALCEECDIVRCAWCHTPSRTHDFAGTPPCEHICSDCGCFEYAEYLRPCERCKVSERLLCSDCTRGCYTCEARYCAKLCLDCNMTFCDGGCSCMFCYGCAFDADLVATCSGCSTARFCDDCEAAHLKTAHEWAAALQLREGNKAVDARIIARLLKATTHYMRVLCGGKEEEEEDAAEEMRICEECAMSLPHEVEVEADATEAAAS